MYGARMGGRRVAPARSESVLDEDRFTPTMQLDLFASAEPTLAAYAERWVAAFNCAPWVSDLTADLRVQHLRTSILPDFGSWPISTISVVACGEWQQRLLARASVGYAKHIAVTFGAVLGQAYRDGLIDKNPLKGLRWPRRNSARPDPYTAREVRTMLRWFQAHKPYYLPLVGLVCLAGMRPSEACGLQWEDVDLDAGSLRIERSAVKRVVGAPKTRRSRRRIRISDEVVRILRAVEPRREWVCTTPQGEQIDSTYWGGFHWRVACKMAGVRNRGFYRGRAAFMSGQAAKGANLLALAEYTGTSVTMLEAHYLRWLKPLEVPGEKRRRRHA